jgi:hypothetical protein
MTMREHEASILHHLCFDGPQGAIGLDRVRPVDAAARRYARLAAMWSLLRLKKYRGECGDAENRQYEVLTPQLRQLTAELGLPTWAQGDKVCPRNGSKPIVDPDPVDGITRWDGHLPREVSMYLGHTWQDTVEIWHGLAWWQQ